MSDTQEPLKIPFPCKGRNCSSPCAKLVIYSETDVRFEWHSRHSNHTHVNELTLNSLIGFLASQHPAYLRAMLKEAA